MANLYPIKNAIELAKDLHRNDLVDPYRKEVDYLYGHPALKNGLRTPKTCTACWIITKAEDEVNKLTTS